jgi:ribonuclease D
MMNPVTATISKNDLMLLPIRRYEGPIHLVTTAAELAAAHRVITAEAVVGFDTETRPTFRKGQSYPPSLVQIAATDGVFLFQLHRLDVAAELAEILGQPQILKVGIALDYDLGALRKVFAFQPRGTLDLGTVAQQHGLKQSGVRNLAGMFLGLRITKGARTTNWANPTLTPAQIQYAATDAWVCRELYVKFRELGWV